MDPAVEIEIQLLELKLKYESYINGNSRGSGGKSSNNSNNNDDGNDDDGSCCSIIEHIFYDTCECDMTKTKEYLKLMFPDAPFHEDDNDMTAETACSSSTIIDGVSSGSSATTCSMSVCDVEELALQLWQHMELLLVESETEVTYEECVAHMMEAQTQTKAQTKAQAEAEARGNISDSCSDAGAGEGSVPDTAIDAVDIYRRGLAALLLTVLTRQCRLLYQLVSAGEGDFTSVGGAGSGESSSGSDLVYLTNHHGLGSDRQSAAAAKPADAMAIISTETLLQHCHHDNILLKAAGEVCCCTDTDTDMDGGTTTTDGVVSYKGSESDANKKKKKQKQKQKQKQGKVNVTKNKYNVTTRTASTIASTIGSTTAIAAASVSSLNMRESYPSLLVNLSVIDQFPIDYVLSWSRLQIAVTTCHTLEQSGYNVAAAVNRLVQCGAVVWRSGEPEKNISSGGGVWTSTIDGSNGSDGLWSYRDMACKPAAAVMSDAWMENVHDNDNNYNDADGAVAAMTTINSSRSRQLFVATGVTRANASVITTNAPTNITHSASTSTSTKTSTSSTNPCHHYHNRIVQEYEHVRLQYHQGTKRLQSLHNVAVNRHSTNISCLKALQQTHCEHLRGRLKWLHEPYIAAKLLMNHNNNNNASLHQGQISRKTTTVATSISTAAAVGYFDCGLGSSHSTTAAIGADRLLSRWRAYLEHYQSHRSSSTTATATASTHTTSAHCAITTTTTTNNNSNNKLTDAQQQQQQQQDQQEHHHQWWEEEGWDWEGVDAGFIPVASASRTGGISAGGISTATTDGSNADEHNSDADCYTFGFYGFRQGVCGTGTSGTTGDTTGPCCYCLDLHGFNQSHIDSLVTEVVSYYCIYSQQQQQHQQHQHQHHMSSSNTVGSITSTSTSTGVATSTSTGIITRRKQQQLQQPITVSFIVGLGMHSINPNPKPNPNSSNHPPVLSQRVQAKLTSLGIPFTIDINTGTIHATFYTK